MAISFAVTWDYRCPFARIAHDHLIAAIVAGGPWQVQFQAFSLDQAHVAEGEPPVWDEPERYPGLLANLAGIVVRDQVPGEFLAVHGALFAARHEYSRDLRQRSVVAAVLNESGVDSDAVLAEIDSGRPLEILRREHSRAVDELEVFGVPTFIHEGRAAFVRLLERPVDSDHAIRTVGRVIDTLVGWPDLNEFKYTQLSR